MTITQAGRTRAGTPMVLTHRPGTGPAKIRITVSREVAVKLTELARARGVDLETCAAQLIAEGIAATRNPGV